MKLRLDQIHNVEPRREHGDIKGLKASIEDVGLICPLAVDNNGNLLAGRRRYQAVKELGWTEVEVVVLDAADPLKAFRIAIDENLKRKPLTDPEVSASIKEYDDLKRKLEGSARQGERTDLTLLQRDKVPWTQAQTAADLGISQPAVVKAIKIATAIEQHPDLAGKSGQAVLREQKRRGVGAITLPTSTYRTDADAP